MTTTERDAAAESALLSQVLALHPAAVTAAELARELGEDYADFAARDAVERAIRDLAAAGLLHRDGGLVRPTRAALRFEQLQSWGA